MIEYGKRIHCDRCGLTIFLQEHDAPVMATGWNTREFDPVPEGWGQAPDRQDKSLCDLCPKCMKTYYAALSRFYDYNADNGAEIVL